MIDDALLRPGRLEVQMEIGILLQLISVVTLLEVLPL